jgi:host factor-I protein
MPAAPAGSERDSGGGYILPVENLCKPLYCGHIAGFGGTGASGAALADLFLPTISRLKRIQPMRKVGDRQMENKPAQNIQDTFLNTVRKDKTPITIYLVSGVKLTGKIRSFDKYSVLLENNSQEQLIFKHAISTVVSNRSVLHSEHRPATMHTGLGPAPVGAPSPTGTGDSPRGAVPIGS